MSSMEQVLLSIIITVVGGPTYLRRCLNTLRSQIAGRNIEIIIPYYISDDEILSLRRELPDVVFLEIPKIPSISQSNIYYTRHEIFDRGKSLGLAYSHGKLVALLDDQGVPAPDWCDRVLETNQLPHAAVGGAIEHTGNNILNWAVYFTDFARYKLPLNEGPVEALSDINVCYKYSALEIIKDVWAEKFNEIAVNWMLLRKGFYLWLNPKLVVQLNRGKLHYYELIKERYAWGRIFGAVRARNLSKISKYGMIILTPALPFVILSRLFIKIFSSKRNRYQLIVSSPIIFSLSIAWVTGELLGNITGK